MLIHAGIAVLKIRFWRLQVSRKSVDVGLAVDIVCDILKKKVDHIILISSDTDLVPAIRVAKDEGAKITYISFDKMIIRPLSVLSNSTITIRGYEIAEAYANSLK